MDSKPLHQNPRNRDVQQTMKGTMIYLSVPDFEVKRDLPKSQRGSLSGQKR
jgi:hypothetical protein